MSLKLTGDLNSPLRRRIKYGMFVFHKLIEAMSIHFGDPDLPMSFEYVHTKCISHNCRENSVCFNLFILMLNQLLMPFGSNLEQREMGFRQRQLFSLDKENSNGI